MQRRRFIGVSTAAAITALAGCSGGSDSDDGPSVSNDETPGSSSETITDERVSLSEDEYQYYEFTAEGTVTLEYDAIVRTGPAIDIILTTQSELTNYENEEAFRYNESGSSLDTENATESTDLDSDDWALILDNTNMGKAQPPANLNDDVAEVEIEATIS